MLIKLLKRLSPTHVHEPAAKKRIRQPKGKDAPVTTSAEQAFRCILFPDAGIFKRKRPGQSSPG